MTASHCILACLHNCTSARRAGLHRHSSGAAGACLVTVCWHSAAPLQAELEKKAAEAAAAAAAAKKKAEEEAAKKAAEAAADAAKKAAEEAAAAAKKAAEEAAAAKKAAKAAAAKKAEEEAKLKVRWRAVCPGDGGPPGEGVVPQGGGCSRGWHLLSSCLGAVHVAPCASHVLEATCSPPTRDGRLLTACWIPALLVPG